MSIMIEVAHPYQMSISLNVLNHLGIGLYSNIPAVLSEVVANAWDADADTVTIDIDAVRGQIVVYDDGKGMTRDDINDKYLNVGYQKRSLESVTTAKGRHLMGRKGIGKLSVFSIADTVDVFTVKDGKRNALSMDGRNIKAQIQDDPAGNYYPDVLDTSTIDFDKGTKIVLRNLRKRIVTTEGFLRRRLAKRFSVIGARHDFRVVIDGAEVTAADRDYYGKIEFVWYFGDLDDGFYQTRPDGSRGLRENIKKAVPLDPVVNDAAGYTVRGWISTVDEQKNIDEDNNTIIIFAHGKLIQEDLLKDLKEAGIYAAYLIGEIEADFMDADDKEDIVTSGRQFVKEDDERYDELKKFVRNVLKKIQNEWSDLRRTIGVEKALTQPIIQQWYQKLGPDTRRSAEKLFGKIESLRISDPVAKRELYKASLLAFEKMALKDSLSLLDAVESRQDFELIARLFAGIDEIEAVHYYQIARGRLEVVKEFQRILPVGKERLLQRHIFDHLWLLDPSWERAASNPRIEQAVTKEFDDIDAKLTPEEKEGRIDIRYRTAAGKHIIIELKKYDRPVTVVALLEQLMKYRSALEKCLTTKFPSESHVIESICILGSPPEPRDRPQENIALLRQINARFITYDELIVQTLNSYQEYLERESKVSELIKLLDDLDQAFGAPPTGATS